MTDRQVPPATRPSVIQRTVSYLERLRSLSLRQLSLIAGAAVGLFLFVGLTAAYVHYSIAISRKLAAGDAQIGTLVYSTPLVVERGEALTQADVVKYLDHAGYRRKTPSRMGRFAETANRLEIETGPDSYFGPNTALVEFGNGRVSRIYSKTDNRESDHILLEPELVTNLVSGEREKRRPVAYSDLPANLVHALVAIEDKRFFDHGGLDLLRAGKAAWVDLREARKGQGASTLTMQLARSYFLDQEKTWRRKLAEVLITVELERRFSKEKILELYANEVYLGRRGSFSVHGFGQAAHAYFNKDVKALTLDESALLVGMIQRPAHFNPFKYPERVKMRRDLVLSMMVNNGFIDAGQAEQAAKAPIRLTPASESSDAPYFVDLVNNEIDEALGERASRQDGARIYTSLDMALQREAVAAIKEAMPEVDRNARAERGKQYQGPMPQVALVALDPHTGAVRALVGGRSYGDSQLNRALAKRQPGSSFKPFVYAAALNTAVEGSRTPITTAMHVRDEATTFRYKDEVYEPGNFDRSFRGEVTLRQALMLSLNVPTVKVAEKTGYARVMQLAKAAGMSENLHATPALALGAYEVTPVEIASAYTIFSNQGEHEKAFFIDSARDRESRVLFEHKDDGEEVLDPRVAYIVTNMMEDVVRYGTGAGIRSRGFEPPAAGKTGTSRDGWFAGFTSSLLTVVWVGYDDNSELNLEGAKSALPVWVNFMKRAHKLPQYRDTKPFAEPKGIARLAIDPSTGGLARPDCPVVRTEVFIEGTQPTWTCDSDHRDDDQGMPEPPPSGPGTTGKVTGVLH